MIPKIIHYCWFGKNPYPEKVQMCIDSWKRILPDYKLVEWNERNFDLSSSGFVRQAYENKKYAFVADYVRFVVLGKYGGLYLDTDVEVLKSFDDILNNKVVLGLDDQGNIEGAFIGSESGALFIESMIDHYDSLKFVLDDGSQNTIVVNYWMQEKLSALGYQKDDKKQVLDSIVIYPSDFFSAKSMVSGKEKVTSNTYCIHHHTLLWVTKKTKVLGFIRTKILVPCIGEKRYNIIANRLKKVFGHKDYKG